MNEGLQDPALFSDLKSAGRTVRAKTPLPSPGPPGSARSDCEHSQQRRLCRSAHSPSRARAGSNAELVFGSDLFRNPFARAPRKGARVSDATRPAAWLQLVSKSFDFDTAGRLGCERRSPMPKHLALYARVSTGGQKLEPQLDPLRDYAARRGGRVVEYVDHGSGAKARRLGLDSLIEACHRREVEAVVVVKLDRLARSVAHLVELSLEFEALGVGLVVLDQGIDTTTPAGRLVFHVFSAIAEFERELIRERVVAGLRSAKRRGVRLGRPSRLDERARARALRLRDAGRSIRAIAAQLEVGVATVQRTLQAR